MAVAAILDLFGWAMGPPTKRHPWCVPPVKISSWSAKLFSSYKHLNFLSFRLESPIHAPKNSVFGGFNPQNLRAHRSDPQKALSFAERRVLSPHWSRSDAKCDLWPWQLAKKTKKITSASVELTQTRHSHSKQLFHGGQISVFLQGGSKSFIRCL